MQAYQEDSLQPAGLFNILLRWPCKVQLNSDRIVRTERQLPLAESRQPRAQGGDSTCA
jgi:hypothetical protein